ncbi:MAG: hypothetical protein ACO1SV_26445 [Fimbriimonas sp.]
MSLRIGAASLVLLGVGLLTFGCGGSGGDSSPSATTPVQFRIAWGARTRAIQAPASALSATVTLNGANPHGGDFTHSVNRTDAMDAYTQTYTSAAPAEVGTHTMTIRFYSGAGGTGDVVATGQATVTIAADGTGIGDVAVGNQVATVTVDAGQVVEFDQTRQLTFTARTAQNAVLAVSPGSATWTVVDGQGSLGLTPDGVATGTAPGPAHVRVTVDGVASESTLVTVANPPDFADASFEAMPLEVFQWRMNAEVVGSGWTGDANWGLARALTPWGTFPGEGANYAFIQASNVGDVAVQGSLKQTITNLKVGQNYRVSMLIARRNGETGPKVGANVTLFANGVQILDPTGPTNTGSFRKVFSKTFVATQTTYEFKIQSLLPEVTPDDTATLVDDVHLERAP